jgi:hypothetical protein
MVIRNTPLAFAASLAVLVVSSCSTLLNSGQFGHDAIVPPPMAADAKNAGETMAFLGGSFAKGNFYETDHNYFGQAGLLRSWRMDKEPILFDGHAAASGWYGAAKLNDHDVIGYKPSVAEPFAFYGGSAQVEADIGFRPSPGLVIDSGIRGSVAYEDGPYRAFRAVATGVPDSATVINACSSGWSGNTALDVALSVSPNNSVGIRFGVLAGDAISDLPGYFASSEETSDIFFCQTSVSLRDDRFVVSVAYNWNILNSGFSASVGYILP